MSRHMNRRSKFKVLRGRLAAFMRLTSHQKSYFVWTVLLCFTGTAFALPPQRVTRTTITAVTPNPSVVGQPVKVSFRVEPSVPGGSLTPTGDVWVMGTAQCKAPVEAGGCTLTIHDAGTTTFMAIYYGDRNFLSSTSTNVITQKVTDFSFSDSSVSPSAEATTPGRTSQQLTLAPRGGFTGRVSLSCAELPAGASCTFSPSFGHAEWRRQCRQHGDAADQFKHAKCGHHLHHRRIGQRRPCQRRPYAQGAGLRRCEFRPQRCQFAPRRWFWRLGHRGSHASGAGTSPRLHCRSGRARDPGGLPALVCHLGRAPGAGQEGA